MATLLLEVAVRAALVATGTACTLWALRIRSAVVRHAAWTTVVVAMLLLPVWSVAGPKIPLAVLPMRAASSDPGSRANSEPTNVARPPSVTRPGPASIAETASAAGESTLGMFVLIVAYMLGAFALLTRLAVGTVHAHRLRRGAVMHRGRATSTRCATPITVGWLSPALILPDGWERWSAARLDAVLTHEREHARRHDPLVQWLALLNRAIFWFHPLAWWLERRLASLAEEACDAAVIQAGHSPQDYSGYLIDMARLLQRQGRRLNVAGLAMPGSGLPDRMRHIFEELPMKPPSRTRVVCTLAFCTMSAVVFAAGMLAPRPSAAAGPQATAGAPARLDDVSLEPDVNLPPPTPAGVSRVTRPPEPVDRAHERVNAHVPIVSEQPRPDSPNSVQVERPLASQTDFSGTWLLVSATSRGTRESGAGSGWSVNDPEVNVTAKWASGAPVNCGPECTITQDTKKLTISRLGTADAVTIYDNGLVVLNLDGTDSSVYQSSGSHYVVHANWEGDKLVVTYHTPWTFTVTQVLSIEGGKLRVVTDFGVGFAPVTLTYEKK